MAYNLHPIFVHFPIALLALYSFLVIVPLERWFQNFDWGLVRKVLLVVGIVGAWAATMTGEGAEELANPPHGLVEVHEQFAGAAVTLYVVLLIGEFLPWVRTCVQRSLRRLDFVLLPLQKVLETRWVKWVLALTALIVLFVTGMLGGVMVYGVQADPLAPFVLRLLGIS